MTAAPALRSGETGHVWEHAPGGPVPAVCVTDDERSRGQRPRWRNGPLVCVNAGCGAAWPGAGPCEGGAKEARFMAEVTLMEAHYIAATQETPA